MSDPLAMSASYVESLTEKQAAQVMAAWVHAKRVELPESLAASKSKVHARLAKKALYQLRSGGVALSEAEPVAQRAVTTEAPTVNEFPAVMTSLIGNGERGLLFGRPIRGGGFEIYEAIIQDEQGIMSMQHGEAPRGLYRERIKQLRKGTNPVLFVTFERIRDELSRAASRNSFAQVPLSLEAQGVLAKLGVVATDVPLGIDASHDDDLGLASQAAGLHDEPEVVSWLPPDTDLQVMAQRLEEQPTASAEQKREVAKALSVNFATPSIRALYANRLWRMAEFFDGTGRLAQGQTARAEARQLLHSTEPSRFLERLFTKVPDAAAPSPGTVRE